MPATSTLEATADNDNIAGSHAPSKLEFGSPTRSVLEPLTAPLPTIPPLRLPPTEQSINATSDAGIVEAAADHLKHHDLWLDRPSQGGLEGGTSPAAIPQVSVAADSDYEINARPNPQETTSSAAQGTAVQPLSFHFTIEEKGANRQLSAPERWQSNAELAPASLQSRKTSGSVPVAPAESSAESALRGRDALFSIGTFVLGLLSFPLILGLCLSLYLRRTVNSGPLFRVELVNPSGGEQPYQVALGRIGLSQGPEVAESALEDTASMPARRQGTVIDEPIPIAPIGPTYDERKRNEEVQRRELEQAMMKQALQENLDLREQIGTDSDM
ncbi:MAG: hypothetical protein WD070_08540 [Pirellulaceae bacterium]